MKRFYRIEHEGRPRQVVEEGGTLRQTSTTRQLIFPIDRLVVFISSVMTLLPGDIISTGTPAGIAPLRAGDSVTIKVGGAGELTNPVAQAVAPRRQ